MTICLDNLCEHDVRMYTEHNDNDVLQSWLESNGIHTDTQEQMDELAETICRAFYGYAPNFACREYADKFEKWALENKPDRIAEYLSNL